MALPNEEEDVLPVPGSSPEDYVAADTPEGTYDSPEAAPAAPAPPALSQSPGSAMSNLDRIADYGQAVKRFDTRTALANQKKQEVQKKREHNAAARLDTEQTGAQYLSDAKGVAQPVVDASTGKRKFTPSTSPVRFNDKGKPYQVRISEDGTPTIEDPDQNADYGENPDDPNDPNIYRRTKATPWQPVDPEEGLKSSDGRLVAASARLLHKRELEKVASDRADIELKLSDPARPRPLAPKKREELSAQRDALAVETPKPGPQAGLFGIGVNQQATAEAQTAWMQQEQDRKTQLSRLEAEIASDDEHSSLSKKSYELALQHKALKDEGPAGYLARRRKQSAAGLAELPPDQAEAELQKRQAALQGADQEISTRATNLKDRSDALTAEQMRGVTSERSAEIERERAGLLSESQQIQDSLAKRNALADDTNAGLQARRAKQESEEKAHREEMRKDPALAPVAKELDAIDAEASQRSAVIQAMPAGPEKEAAVKVLSEEMDGRRQSQQATLKKVQYPRFAQQEHELRSYISSLADGDPEKPKAQAHLDEIEKSLGNDPDYQASRASEEKFQNAVKRVADIEDGARQFFQDIRWSREGRFLTDNTEEAKSWGIRKANAETDATASLDTPEQVARFHQAVTNLRIQKTFSENSNPKGFWDKIHEIRDNPAQLLPFIASAPELAAITDVGNAVKKIQAGTATNDDFVTAATFAAQNQAKKSMWYNVAGVLAMLPSFAGELVMTGGAYSLGKEAAVKGAVKGLESLSAKGAAKWVETMAVAKLGEQGAKELLGQLAVKSAASMAGSAAQLPLASFGRITGEYASRTMPQIQELVRNDKGALTFLTKDGEKPLQAGINSVANQYVEVFSEHSGAAFDILGKVVGKAIPAGLRNKIGKAFIFGKWMEKNPGAKPSQFGKLLKEAGWNGVFQEMGEERIGDLARGFTEFAQRLAGGEGFVDAVKKAYDDNAPDSEQLLTELISFSVPGAAISGANFSVGKVLGTENVNKPSAGPAIRPEQVAAVNVQIDAWQPPAGLTPEGAQTERLAASGAIKLISGRPVESLLAEERTALESKLPDKSPRMEDVGGVPVITKGQLSRLQQVAPETATLPIRDEESLRTELISKNEKPTPQTPQQPGPAADQAGLDPQAGGANRPQAQNPAGQAVKTSPDAGLSVSRGTEPPLPAGKPGARPASESDIKAASELHGALLRSSAEPLAAKEFADHFVTTRGSDGWAPQTTAQAVRDFHEAAKTSSPAEIVRAIRASQSAQAETVNRIYDGLVASLEPDSPRKPAAKKIAPKLAAKAQRWNNALKLLPKSFFGETEARSFSDLTPEEKKRFEFAVKYRLIPEALATGQFGEQNISATFDSQGGGGMGIVGDGDLQISVPDLIKKSNFEAFADVRKAELSLRQEALHKIGVATLADLCPPNLSTGLQTTREKADAYAASIWDRIPTEDKTAVEKIRGGKEKSPAHSGHEFLRMLAEGKIGMDSEGKLLDETGAILTEQRNSPGLVAEIKKYLAHVIKTASSLVRGTSRFDPELSRELDAITGKMVEGLRNSQKTADATRNAAYREKYGPSNNTSTRAGADPGAMGGTGTGNRPANVQGRAGTDPQGGAPAQAEEGAQGSQPGVQPGQVAGMGDALGQNPAQGLPGLPTVTTPATSETGYQFDIRYKPKGSDEIVTETVRLTSKTAEAALVEQKKALLGIISKGTLKERPTKLVAATEPAQPEAQEPAPAPAAEPVAPDATPEPEAPTTPAKRKSSTRPDRATIPIIAWLDEHGGIQSKKKAGTTDGGEYEQSGGVRRYGAYSKSIYGNGMPADVAVTGLVESGLMPEGSTADDLWVSIDAEIAGAKKSAAREEALGEDERLAMQFAQEFQSATSKGPGKILANTSNMQPGHILDAGPAGRFIVDHITEQGDVALIPEDAPEDGVRAQIVEAGTSLYLAKPIEDGMETPFSIAETPTGGIGIATVERAVDAAKKRFGLENVKGRVVGNITGGPKNARRNAAGQIEGYFDPRTAEYVLNASAISSPKRAMEVFLHEAVGHGGMSAALQGINPKGYENLSRLLQNFKREDGSSLWADVQTRYPDASPEVLFDEALARLAENPARSEREENFFKRIVDAIRNWLTKRGFSDWTAADVDALIRRSADAVRDGKITGGKEGIQASHVGQTLREAESTMVEDKPETPLSDTGKSNHEILRDAAEIFKGWPETLVAADGSGIDMKITEGESLGSRVFHLVRDKQTNGINKNKAAWLPMVPDTLKNAQLRLDDTQDKTRIFVRKYAGGIIHAVVVRPDGKISEQNAFTGHLETQFPLVGLDRTRQQHLKADWVAERINDNGLRQTAPEATPPDSTVSGPRQKEFQGDDTNGNPAGQGDVQFSRTPPEPSDTKEWQQFDPKTGSLGIPRDEMPQVPADARGALVNFLKARGIEITNETVPSASLKPSQAEFNPEKVEKARELMEGTQRKLLVSSDNYLLDGHHQWLASEGRNVGIARLSIPAKEALAAIAELPSTNGGELASELAREQPETEANIPIDEQTARSYATSVGASNVEEATNGISRTLQLIAPGRVGESGSYSQGDLFAGKETGGTGASIVEAGKKSAASLHDQKTGSLPKGGIASADLIAGLQGDWEALAREIDAKGRASSIYADLVNNRIPDWDVTGTKIESPEDVLALVQPIRSPYFESLKVMVLDGNSNVAYSQILHVGAIAESIASPTRIFGALARLREATGKNYQRIILSHNHPSGDPAPSSADRRLQRALDEIATATGWDVTDHVITNGETYFSFRDAGIGGTSTPGKEYTPRKDTGTRPSPNDPLEKADWEAVRRSKLALMDDGRFIAAAAKSLRNANPDSAHIFYLNTKMRLTAVERISLSDFLDQTKRNRAILAGMAREGGYGFAVEIPGGAPTAEQRRIASSLREFSSAASLNIMDMVLTDTSATPAGPPYFSFRDSGLMEDPAPYGNRVNDEQTDFNFLPEDQPAAQADAGLDPIDRFKAELPQAMRIAAGYDNIPGVDQAEVRQTARLALADAARKFDGALGKPFAAYAGVAVRNRLRSLYRKEDLRRERFPVSLDEPVGADSAGIPATRGDFAPDTRTASAPDAAARDEAAGLLEEAISTLPQKMQVAVRGFNDRKTLEQIGEELGGVSKQRVGQVLDAAMRRMRGKLGELGVTNTAAILSAPQPENPDSGDFDIDATIAAIMADLEATKKLDFQEIYDQQTAALAEEASGAQRKIGRPDLAYGASNPDVRGADQAYTDGFIPETEAEWEKSAENMLSRDYDGTTKEIILAGLSKQPLTPAQAKAARIIAADLRRKMLSGDEEARKAFNTFWYSYRSAGSAAGRALAALRDIFQTPAMRYREFLTDLMLRPRRAAQKEIDRAPSQSEKDTRIADLEKRLKLAIAQANAHERASLQKQIVTVKAEPTKEYLIDEETKALLAKLKAVGIKPEDIMQDKVALTFIYKNIKAGFTAILASGTSDARKHAFELILKNKAFAAIAKETGLPEAEVRQIKADFISKMRKDHFEDFKHGAKADGAALRRESLVDDAAAEQEFAKFLKTFGIVDDAIQGKPKFDVTDPAHVMRVAREIQSARAETSLGDMAFEWWIMNILSGPQTHVSNITGNLGMATLHLTVQRGMEAAFNVLIRDSKAASFGEFKYLAKGLLPGISKGYLLGAKAWSAEHDFFEHTFVGTPLELDREDKLGGTRAAIPGKAGKFIRIPGRALLFADSMFKTVIGQMEAGAHAYRLAKAEGLTGNALSNRIELLMKTRGEIISENATKPAADAVEYFARQLARRDPTLDADDLIADRTSDAWTLAGEQAAFEKARAKGWSEKAWENAVESARVNTFQQDLLTTENGGNIVEDIAAKLQNARFGNKMIGFFFPFVRTPYNIFRVGLRKSVFGSANLGVQLGKGLYSMKNGKPYIEGHPEVVRDLAEQAIAWGAFTLLFAAAQGDDDDDDKKFLITGSQPINDTSRGQRDLNTRAFGGEYVIRLGGRNGLSIQYGRLEPIATVLGVTVDSIRAIKRNGTPADNMNALWAFISGQVNNKGFLQGMQNVTDLLNGRRNPPSIATKTALQFLVPNLIRQPLRNIDDYARDTQTAGPGYQLMPSAGNAAPKINVYGEPVKKEGNPIARIFFQSPLATDATLNQTDKLLLNWNRTNPEDAWAPSEPAAVFKGRDGKNIDMTAEEKTNFYQAAGRLASARLRGVVNARNSASPTAADIKAVKKAFDDARDEAKARIFNPGYILRRGK